MPSENPFVFDQPLEDRRDLLEREDQLGKLIEAVRAGRDVLIEGPYRHGKTSLINVALAELVAEAGGIGVRVDCSGVLTASDFARRVKDACVGARVVGAAEATLVERLEIMSLVRTATPEARLDALLDLPAEIAERLDGRAVICFDEFQDAAAVPAVVDAIRKARGDDRVVRVFSGPELASLEAVPRTKRTPVVTVGRIDPIVFAGAIQRRFADTGRDAGETPRVLATLGAGHPQRTNLLAALLWDRTAEGERAPVPHATEVVEQAVARCTPEFEARWQALHGNERRVAVAIANGIAPQGTRAQREVGLAGFGAAQRAVRGIESRGFAEVRDERMTLTDPLFAEWLKSRYSQAPPEPNWATLRQLRERRLERGIERGHW